RGGRVTASDVRNYLDDDTTAPTVSIDPVATPTSQASYTLTGSFTDAFLKDITVERDGVALTVASLPSDGRWRAAFSAKPNLWAPTAGRCVEELDALAVNRSPCQMSGIIR
ncbi:MAG: hypothetical protein ACE1Y9_04015, partial [Acidimicrobiia bacterium]